MRERGRTSGGAWRIAAVVLSFGAGCSQIIGFGDVTLELDGGVNQDDGGGSDAALDAPADAMPDSPPPNIYAFVTNASFNGGFGATGGARVTADIKCQDMYNLSFTGLGCTPANIHAFIQVDDVADTLARLDINYPIPQDSPVVRATDMTPVANSWDSFVDPNMQLLSPVSTSASSVYFWSGRSAGGNLQCANWTSASSSMSGNAGDATKVASWTTQSNFTCNNFSQHFVCFCW